jgi:hypothetical protein
VRARRIRAFVRPNLWSTNACRRGGFRVSLMLKSKVPFLFSIARAVWGLVQRRPLRAQTDLIAADSSRISDSREVVQKASVLNLQRSRPERLLGIWRNYHERIVREEALWARLHVSACITAWGLQPLPHWVWSVVTFQNYSVAGSNRLVTYGCSPRQSFVLHKPLQYNVEVSSYV